MKKNPIVIYGAGGHAKVIADILFSIGYSLKAFIDDMEEKTHHYDYPVLSGRSAVAEDDLLVIGIGDNNVRRCLSQDLEGAFRFVSALVHQSAVVSPSALLGEGTCVMAGSVVNADARIGRHVILNTGSRVEHDCEISDWVHVAPGAILCGGVKIGESTLLGVGCSILPGVSIGNYCVVGGGSVVSRDLPDNCTVVGNPARGIKNVKD